MNTLAEIDGSFEPINNLGMFMTPFFVNRLVHVLPLIAGTIVSCKTTLLFARQQPVINFQALNYSMNVDDNNTDTATKPTANSAAIIPQNLHQISISGEWLSSSIKLMWKCTDKTPILYYELQRSRDSSKFIPLLLMHAKDATRYATGYRFTDTDMPSGTCYYRLRIEDMDGRESYSQIIACSPRKTNIPVHER